MNERESLDRFIRAQEFNSENYPRALEEIKSGRKVTHWIWYIFPQRRGLGHSFNADYYGISDLDEACRYLAHPLLGARLREISEALLSHAGKSPIEILGSIDALKVRSSMTLFDHISPDDIFARVLDTFYDGMRDPKSV